VSTPTNLSGSLLKSIQQLLLIVLGVCIALVLVNWNRQRTDRKLETEYLQSLAKDLESDTALLTKFILKRYDDKMESLSSIAGYSRKQNTTISDTLAFLDHLGKGGLFGFGLHDQLNPFTYHDLIHTGNLKLIKDFQLREQITAYYFQQEVTTTNVNDKRSFYPLFVHGLLPAELREARTMEVLRTYDIDRILRKLQSDEFITILNKEINYALNAKRQAEKMLESARVLLKVLNQENQSLHSKNFSS
jgi:hypothetical protein